MSQDTLNPTSNVANNVPNYDPTATPAPADRFTAALERVDVFALAEQVAADMRNDDVNIEVEGPHAVVPTHPGMLRPMLKLLTQDAMCSATPGCTIRIQVRVQGYDVDLVVKDPAMVPAEESGAGAGLAEAQPLARRIGARLQLSLDEDGFSEVRVRLPRLDPTTTILVVGSLSQPLGPTAARIGMSTLTVATVEEALDTMVHGSDVCGAVFLADGWASARSRDVLALRCALLPAPVVSVGPPPDTVASLVDVTLSEPVSHRDLHEALLSARQT